MRGQRVQGARKPPALPHRPGLDQQPSGKPRTLCESHWRPLRRVLRPTYFEHLQAHLFPWISKTLFAFSHQGFFASKVQDIENLAVRIFLMSNTTTPIPARSLARFKLRGLDDLVSAGIGLEYDDREDLLVETMRRGHLAPVYRNSDGDQAPTAPEKKDRLVIDEPVDVFHAGHTHKFGFCERGGTSMALSGTFQGQTSYQKSKGITPDPSKVFLLNLATGRKEKTLSFAS